MDALRQPESGNGDWGRDAGGLLWDAGPCSRATGTDQAAGWPGSGGRCAAIQRAHCWGVFWRASQRRVA